MVFTARIFSYCNMSERIDKDNFFMHDTKGNMTQLGAEMVQSMHHNDLKRNTRIDWLDMAKGYGMLLVMFSHLGIGKYKVWIYTFHMPLFFFLSGFVFSTKYDFKTFFKRKCKAILVPYFALGIPMVLFKIMEDTVQSGVLRREFAVTVFLKFLIQKRYLTLWYIACLFFLNLIFYIILKICKKLSVTAIVVLLALLLGLEYYKIGGPALPWNIDVCLTGLSFFFCGYVLKIYYPKLKEKMSIKISVLCLCVCVLVNIAFGYWGRQISGAGMEMFKSKYGFPPFSFLSAFAGIFCVVLISHYFTNRLIKYIGRNSLLYYAWHQTIMIPVVRSVFQIVGIPFENFPNDYAMLCERVIELIFVVFALTICNIIISNSKLKFMLGH
ncbi:MAG: acyltransferase [Candidatus Choladocola sp.]|nr:acyltransferase [Candidatus Choladocola sp.]